MFLRAGKLEENGQRHLDLSIYDKISSEVDDMTLTVNVPAELETELETEARRSGMSNDEFVRIALKEKLRRRPVNGQKSHFEAKIIATDLPIRNRSLEYAWLDANRDEYDGKYVALDGALLVAIGEEARIIATKLREIGNDTAMILFVEGSSRPQFISGGLW